MPPPLFDCTGHFRCAPFWACSVPRTIPPLGSLLPLAPSTPALPPPPPQVLPLGLFRPKAENPFWRLNYVSTHPAWADIVEAGDRVFVLRPAEGGSSMGSF